MPGSRWCESPKHERGALRGALGDAEILMDPEDLETLESVLAAGWSLEMPRDRRSGTRTPTLVLRGFGSIKLARAIMQATESQYVFQTGPSGPLTAGRPT